MTQRWMPVVESEVTRGLAAMIAFNRLDEYADCRLCRLTDLPDAPSVSVPVEVIKAIETLMIKAAGGHKPPYDAPLYEWEKPTEFYIVEKWLEQTKEGE